LKRGEEKKVSGPHIRPSGKKKKAKNLIKGNLVDGGGVLGEKKKLKGEELALNGRGNSPGEVREYDRGDL